jgi:O-antigen ligase
MTQRVIKVLAYSVPAIGMVGGLTATPLVTLLILFLLFTQKQWDGVKSLLLHHKNIACFLLFALLSCFWSPNVLSSILMWLQLSFLSLVLLNLIQSNNRIDVIMPWLNYGIMTAIVLFYVEYYTEGIISQSFRRVFQQSSHNQHFALSMLDRGCSMLAIYTWFAIWYILPRSKFLASLLYVVVLVTLGLSDNTSGFVAFIAGGIVFVVLYITKMRLVWLMTVGFIIAIIAVPIFTYKQDPMMLSDKYLGTHLSWQHRLFIWDFVAHKANERPIFGHGFNSSRYLGEDKVVHHHDMTLPLLPLHPHNNILQIWLELGFVGLALFALILCGITSEIKKHYTEISGSLVSAALINYFVIGMISFGIWQSWWVCTGLFATYIAVGMKNRVI